MPSNGRRSGVTAFAAGAHCAYTVMLPWSGMATVPLPGPRIVSPLPGVGFMAQPLNRKPGLLFTLQSVQ